MSPIKVLLIADEPERLDFIRKISQKRAEERGFDLTGAGTLKDGLFRLGEEEFDALVLDLYLPDSRGMETFIKTQERTAGKPTIILTRPGDEEAAAEAVRMGAQDYLLKGEADGNLLERSVRIAIERKKAEKKVLQENERRCRALFDRFPDSIMITDADGNILCANSAFESMTGYLRDEVTGRRAEFFCGEMHDKAFCEQIRETAERGEVWKGRITQKRKDGRTFEIEAAVSPVWNDNGSVDCVTVVHDVTREVELENQLRQAQKMEAIGTLAGGILHDFNNILGIIMGYTEMAMVKDENAPAKRYLEQVMKGAFRARDLVKQILAYTRQSEGEKQPVDITLIVKEALKLLRASLPSTIEIRQDIQDPPFVVLADPIRIYQVLMNLCTNAHHGMGGGGGILTVGLYHVDLDMESADRPKSKKGGCIKLTVGDTGHGMNISTPECTFEPRFKSGRPGEDSGLGLAVVQGIVRDHGGQVKGRSEPGGGAVFEVYLPSYERRAAPEVQPAAYFPRGSESILYVDDESALVTVGKEMLEHLGYGVVATTSSEEAVDIFRRKPDRFDLVITDQTMPHITGTQLAARVKKIRPDIPILLCTGLNDLFPMEGAVAAGIREVLRKPFNLGDVATMVRRVLDDEKKD